MNAALASWGLPGAGTLGLIALGALLLLAVATWAHLVFWTRKLTNQRDLPYDELETLPTPDGGRIELRRIHARADGEPAAPVGPPVLMVHGLAINHRNLDMHPDYSLPRYMAERGRDVWLLTLRSGQRVSSAPVTFEAMVHGDLPTAVDAVLARAGAEQLDYVGFSMGGMLLYGALGRTVAPSRVRKAVIMGSPARVGIPIWPFNKTSWLPRAIVPRLHLRWGARLVAFGTEWFTTPFHRVPYNPDNVDRGVVGGILVDGIQDIPASLNRDFAHWAWGDNEIRIGGERVLDTLATVSTPVLFFAGADDRLAPPMAVRHAHDAWGSKAADPGEKRWISLSRADGAGHDYGHGDIVIARRSIADVYEPTCAFLGVRGDAQLAPDADAPPTEPELPAPAAQPAPAPPPAASTPADGATTRPTSPEAAPPAPVSPSAA